MKIDVSRRPRVEVLNSTGGLIKLSFPRSQACAEELIRLAASVNGSINTKYPSGNRTPLTDRQREAARKFSARRGGGCSAAPDDGRPRGPVSIPLPSR